MKTGKLPESVLKRSVLKQIHKLDKKVQGAAVGADCAFFAIPEGKTVAWRAQEAAVAVQADGGEVTQVSSKRASVSDVFAKCVNNLAAAGATPVSAQMTLSLPEEFEEDQVKRLISEAVEICRTLKITISGGDTNISDAVSAPILSVTVMGWSGQEKATLTGAKAGQALVLSKWIGLEGTAVLAKANREALLARYPAYLVDEAADFGRYLSVMPEARIAVENGARVMHDLSQGGVFGALWELAEGAGLGLNVDIKKISIRQETVEVCEVCGVNPYEMRSAGSLLIAAEDGEALAAALEAAGIPATVIGSLTDKKDRVVINGEETRYLDRPRGADLISQI